MVNYQAHSMVNQECVHIFQEENPVYLFDSDVKEALDKEIHFMEP